MFLSGPPKAGKSRLRGDIYRQLVSSGARSWFVQVLSPDMEGQWVNDAHALGNGPRAEEIARRAKQAVKAAGEFFSPAFVAGMRSQLEGLLRAFRLVVADLGGLPSPQNEEIVSVALGRAGVLPRAVVLERDGCDGGWCGFWRRLGVEFIVVSYSPDVAKLVLEGGDGSQAATR